MRRLALLTALIVLGACHRAPSFDERYDKADAEVRQRAVDIDNQISPGP